MHRTATDKQGDSITNTTLGKVCIAHPGKPSVTGQQIYNILAVKAVCVYMQYRHEHEPYVQYSTPHHYLRIAARRWPIAATQHQLSGSHLLREGGREGGREGESIMARTCSHDYVLHLTCIYM